MRIQHNIMAMNAYRNYNTNTSALSKNLEKLSSGYKINRAGDDAAGLAISEKMRAQITGLNAAQKNVKDGISLVKTAEGAMQEIQDMLNRMDYLATQSANGTYDDPVDRKNLQKEVDALRSEINRIADSANFNGIKLLDGSLDTNRSSAAASAISNVNVEDYAASGTSPAFTAKYVTNRPEAATQQTNASFSVSLDDQAVNGIKEGDKFTLNVGGTKITYEVQNGDTVSTAAELAAKLAKCGKEKDADNATYAGGTATPNVDGKDTTAKWTDLTGAATADETGANADAKYVEIGGHWYEMGVNTNSVTFTQVDYMGTSGEVINPDYNVNLSKTAAGTGSTSVLTGTVNWQNQMTVQGIGKGTAHQAQATVDIDFSKLKDGDVLVFGEKKIGFKVGANGAGNASADANVDLHEIFASEADLADADKQAEAMVKITKAMGDLGSATWSTGNGGVKDGVGTLTFQSLSSYTGDATKNAGTKYYVGQGTTAGTLCDMKTEAGVMAQFSSERGEQSAATTFDLDVTKIKVGDTFTIDGTTFEFTDSESGVTKGNIKIDLTAEGIGGGIASYKTNAVMTKIKTAVDAQLKDGGGAKYTTSFDGNTFKLVSKDISGTDAKENKIAAEVKLPEGALNGKGLVLQIGDTSDDFNQLSVSVGDMHTKALKIDGINISNAEGAKSAIQVVKDAINYVSEVRGTLGATQNRLEHTANNLSVMAENIQDAESTIRDTDIAEEMMAYTKNNILVQSAQAMLAQANAVPQGVLQLLG